MYEIIKDFAGLKTGAKINLSDEHARKMIKRGYVKPVEQPKKKKNESKTSKKVSDGK